MKIIALTGRAGAGKDTVATMLSAALNERSLSTQQMAFADPMRWALAAMGVPEQYMVDRDLKEQPVPAFGASYRQLAQTMGDWGRTHGGPDFWVRRMAARIERMHEVAAHRPLPDVLVLTDVRFHNEADMVTKLGGTIIRVERHAALAVRPHQSEEQYIAAHHLLLNNGTLDDLRTSVNTLLFAIAAGRAQAAQSTHEVAA